MMTLMQVGLEDKYRLDAKRIYLSGVQALVRLPMLQRERDRAAGLNTAGFISGYRGSPLGMYDHALWRGENFSQKKHTPLFSRPQQERRARARGGAASRSACSLAPRSMACSASGTARAPASIARLTRSSTPIRPVPRRM